MDALLRSLLTFVLLYKYAAIFALTFFASMAVPIPSGAMVVASFFFATQGYMSAPLVALANVAGNILGDLLTFWLTRRYGEEFMRKIGFGRLLRATVVQRLEAKIARYPVTAVFISRLTTGLTPVANVLAGFTKMSFRVFAAAAIVGEALETAINFVYGTFFGNEIVYVSQVIGLTGMLLLLVIALLTIVLWRRRRARRHAAALAATEHKDAARE